MHYLLVPVRTYLDGYGLFFQRLVENVRGPISLTVGEMNSKRMER